MATMMLAEFRLMALALPEARESSHFDTADFRVGKTIFATLRDKDGRAVVKLSPDQQRLLMETNPGVFKPVKRSWGQKGWTQISLEDVDPAVVRHAMHIAWRSVAPKSLRG